MNDPFNPSLRRNCVANCVMILFVYFNVYLCVWEDEVNYYLSLMFGEWSINVAFVMMLLIVSVHLVEVGWLMSFYITDEDVDFPTCVRDEAWNQRDADLLEDLRTLASKYPERKDVLDEAIEILEWND